MKKRVLVDMDGVLADVYHQFIKYEERDSGIRIKIEDSKGLDETIAFPMLTNIYMNLDFSEIYR